MIEFRNLTKRNIGVKELKRVAKRVLQGEKRPREHLSVVFVGPKLMRTLHKRYRGKDKAANVLAFPGKELGLGEIVLCPEAISKDISKYGILKKQALSFMLAHGLLHLLLYDHETEKDWRIMKQKEQHYLSFK